MAPWVKKVFIGFLPKLLCITRPPRPQQLSEWELNALPTRGTEISIVQQQQQQQLPADMELARQQHTATIKPSRSIGGGRSGQLENGGTAACQQHSAPKKRNAAGPILPVEMDHSIEDVRFIAQHMRNKDRFDSVSPLRLSLSLAAVSIRQQQQRRWQPSA